MLVYASAHDISAVVVRLSNVFGPRASIHSPEFTFNNYFIGLALQGKDITVFGEGKQVRNVLYVEDAVVALIEVSQAAGIRGEVIFAVAEATVRSMGKGKVRFVEWPKDRKSTESGDAILSNEKIKRLVKWNPAYDLRSGLEKTKLYYEHCLDKYLR